MHLTHYEVQHTNNALTDLITTVRRKSLLNTDPAFAVNVLQRWGFVADRAHKLAAQAKSRTKLDDIVMQLTSANQNATEAVSAGHGGADPVEQACTALKSEPKPSESLSPASVMNRTGSSSDRRPVPAPRRQSWVGEGDI